MKNKSIIYITKTAIIAALYAGLTIALIPISFNIIQFRISEVFTILPRYSKTAIPGLTIGCILANYIGGVITGNPFMLQDITFGSLATLLAALCSYYFRKNKILVPLFPTLFNGVIVGTYLHFIVFNNVNIFLCMLSVALGELVVTYVLGLPLMTILDKHKNKIGDIDA